MNVIPFILQAFINTLASETVKKLCIRSLRRGIGSIGGLQPFPRDSNTKALGGHVG